MQDIFDHSTYVRALCNFSPSAGVNYTDYIRLKLSEINRLTFKGEKCVTVEFFSFVGSSSSNCSLKFYHNSQWSFHPHIDCFLSPTTCSTSAFHVPGCSATGQDLFGPYKFVLHTHGCSSSPSAKTQWWFGGKL